MTPFVITDLVDELRIIARDDGRLSTDDRARLAAHLGSQAGLNAVEIFQKALEMAQAAQPAQTSLPGASQQPQPMAPGPSGQPAIAPPAPQFPLPFAP